MNEKYLQCQQRGGLNDLAVDPERHPHKVHPIEEFGKRDSANGWQIQAPNAVKEQEADEVFVIFLTDTLSDPEIRANLPDAMMIEFSNTHFADGAVLGTGGFEDIAGFALVVFLVDDLIVVWFIFFGLLFCVLGGDFARGDGAGFVVDPEADEGEEVGQDDMNVADLVVRHVLEDAQDLIRSESTLWSKVPTDGDNEVENLDDGVVGLHEVGLDATQAGQCALAENSWDEVAALLCRY